MAPGALEAVAGATEEAADPHEAADQREPADPEKPQRFFRFFRFFRWVCFLCLSWGTSELAWAEEPAGRPPGGSESKVSTTPRAPDPRENGGARPVVQNVHEDGHLTRHIWKHQLFAPATP